MHNSAVISVLEQFMKFCFKQAKKHTVWNLKQFTINCIPKFEDQAMIAVVWGKTAQSKEPSNKTYSFTVKIQIQTQTKLKCKFRSKRH